MLALHDWTGGWCVLHPTSCPCGHASGPIPTSAQNFVTVASHGTKLPLYCGSEDIHHQQYHDCIHVRIQDRIDFLYRVVESAGSLSGIEYFQSCFYFVADAGHLACRLATPRTAGQPSVRFTRCCGIGPRSDSELLIDVCPFPAASDARMSDTSPSSNTAWACQSYQWTRSHGLLALISNIR